MNRKEKNNKSIPCGIPSRKERTETNVTKIQTEVLLHHTFYSITRSSKKESVIVVWCLFITYKWRKSGGILGLYKLNIWVVTYYCTVKCFQWALWALKKFKNVG